MELLITLAIATSKFFIVSVLAVFVVVVVALYSTQPHILKTRHGWARVLSIAFFFSLGVWLAQTHSAYKLVNAENLWVERVTPHSVTIATGTPIAAGISANSPWKQLMDLEAGDQTYKVVVIDNYQSLTISFATFISLRNQGIQVVEKPTLL